VREKYKRPLCSYCCILSLSPPRIPCCAARCSGSKLGQSGGEQPMERVCEWRGKQ
jgi:hypothetical protein